MYRTIAVIRVFVLFAIITVPSSALAAKPAEEVPLIPRELFFGNPEKARVRISPDGNHLSYLAPKDGVLNVWVRSVGANDDRPVTSATARPIRNYTWAENSEQILYLMDRDGDENDHVYAVNVSNGADGETAGSIAPLDLTPFDGAKAMVVASDQSFPDELLIAINNRTPQAFDVHRINTRTGEGKVVFENTEGYAGFIADASLDVRVVTRMRRDGGLESFIRDTPDSPWYELARWHQQDAANSGPLSFARDNKTVYISDSRNVETARLFAYSMNKTGDPTYKQLAFDDRCDLNDVLFDPATGKPQAVSFEYDRVEWKVIDSAVQDDLDFLKKSAPGELLIVDRARNDHLWVVAYLRDNGPVEYSLYHRDQQRLDYLFSNRPELENLPLAPMTPKIITSRDGLSLVSYLTLPVGHKSGRLPMVLLVHGGPWARDSWGYNSLHQWLANRGYAVLSVNFRGSTGFGKSFVNAGDREWARAMHNDLIDAVNWAIDQKIADKNRVAIMGGSYGGYATLVGLTFTPDFFAAGVDIVGPSHIKTLLSSIPPHWEPVKAMFETRVGRLDEEEYLDSISPLTKVDEINRPLLIGQGANDPRVKEAESRQIVEAMQQKNLPVTYILFPDEGHGFAKPTNNMAFFAVTEAFLAEHIGGRAEPIGSDVRQSSAIIEAGGELIQGLTDASP